MVILSGFAKVVKIYPEKERKRLSKRSRQREIGDVICN